MNKVNESGYLAEDPKQIGVTSKNNIPIVRVLLAVRRKARIGRKVDFIPFTAYGAMAASCMNNLKKGTGASIESNISIQPVKDPKTGEVTFQLTLPIQYIDFFPLTQNPDTMDTGEDGGKLVMNESLDEPEDG